MQRTPRLFPRFWTWASSTLLCMALETHNHHHLLLLHLKRHPHNNGKGPKMYQRRRIHTFVFCVAGKEWKIKQFSTIYLMASASSSIRQIHRQCATTLLLPDHTSLLQIAFFWKKYAFFRKKLNLRYTSHQNPLRVFGLFVPAPALSIPSLYSSTHIQIDR